LACPGIWIILEGPAANILLLGRVVGRGIDQPTALSFYGMLELVFILLGILGAALFAYLIHPKKEVESEDELNEELN
jgi:hypothetical protein